MKKVTSGVFIIILTVSSLGVFTACGGDNPNNTTTTTTRAGEADRKDESSSSTTGTSGSTGNQSKEEHNGSQNDAAGTMTNSNRSTSGIDE